MKTIYTKCYPFLLFLLMASPFVKLNAQCVTCTTCSVSASSGCTYVVTAGSNETTAFTILAGEKLCIQSGSYAGEITIQGGDVVIASGAIFNGTVKPFIGVGGSTGGTITIKAGGNAIFPQLNPSSSSNLTVNNCGNLSFTGHVLGSGNFSLNNSATGNISSPHDFRGDASTIGGICNEGDIIFGRIIINGGGVSIVNQATMTTTGKFQTNTGSFIVCGGSLLTVEGDFQGDGATPQGIGACGAIYVKGNSACAACTFSGGMDFCDTTAAINALGVDSIFDTGTTPASSIASTVTTCECSVLPPEILPITLAYFTVSCNSNIKTLKWATLAEINNDYFTIEKSKDAVNFIEVGYVTGAGNSNGLRYYSFVDTDDTYPYYRLKQTDFNGKFEYFNVVAAENCKTTSSISVFPNPTNNTLNIYLENTNQQWELLNAMGQKVLPPHAFISEKHVQLNMRSLAQGIYFLKVLDKNTGLLFSEKIIKR